MEEVEAEAEGVTEAWALHLGSHLCWCCRGNYCGSWRNLQFLCHLVCLSLFASCPKPSQQPQPRPEERRLIYHHLPQLSQTILEVPERLPTKCLLPIMYTLPQPESCFDAFAMKGGKENLSPQSEGVSQRYRIFRVVDQILSYQYFHEVEGGAVNCCS